MNFKQYLLTETVHANPDKYWAQPGNIVWVYTQSDLYWVDKKKGLFKNRKNVLSFQDLKDLKVPIIFIDNFKRDQATHDELANVVSAFDSSLIKKRLWDGSDMRIVRGRVLKKDIGVWGYKAFESNKKWTRLVEKAIDAIYRYIL